jgi:hypothetical protein
MIYAARAISVTANVKVLLLQSGATRQFYAIRLVALHLLDLRLNDRLKICDLHLTSAECVVLAVRKSGMV